MQAWSKDKVLRTAFLPLWTILSFQAGFINSFGFLACGRFVSHVTGFGTQVGLALGEGNWAFALEMFGTPFFFILGAFVAGIYTSARHCRNLAPHYSRVSGLLPAILLVLMFFGVRGQFGPFGEELLYFHDFVLLFSLSFACGLQNACFSNLTGGLIRTTHLTGLSTDLGVELSKGIYGQLTQTERDRVWRSNLNRIFCFLSFAAGSIFSIRVSKDLHYLSLAVPLFSSIAVFLITMLLEKRAIPTAEDQARALIN